MIKKLVLSALIVLLAFLGYHYKSLLYGLEQASGQAKILWNAQAIDELLNDPNFSDSTKAKFKYIEKVKEFAQNELGLDNTTNYHTFYDQKGEAILWIVTASPEFEIKAYQWTFPIAGSFSYKGFFDRKKAVNEANLMNQKGYDTEISEVNAWSTLGWFSDPILSSMLNRSAGSLAELIIHELSHASVYRKDEIAFNENFATFVGRKGAEAFLKANFGPNSQELNAYLKEKKRKLFYKSFMQSSIKELNELYASFNEQLSTNEKRLLKSQAIKKIKNRLANSTYYLNLKNGKARLANFDPNNAYFSGFSTYHANQHQLEERIKKEFNGNLKALIEAIKKE